MEKTFEIGLVKRIGLYNFENDDLDDILTICIIKLKVE